jgi:hypothetical protein
VPKDVWRRRCLVLKKTAYEFLQRVNGLHLESPLSVLIRLNCTVSGGGLDCAGWQQEWLRATAHAQLRFPAAFSCKQQLGLGPETSCECDRFTQADLSIPVLVC